MYVFDYADLINVPCSNCHTCRMLINQRVDGDWLFLTSIQSLQGEHEMVENEHENIKLTGRRWSESGGGASEEGNGTKEFHGERVLCCLCSCCQYERVRARAIT